MLNSIKTYLIIFIILILICIGSWFYSIYKENKQLKYDKIVLTQNNEALRDEFTKSKDSIQIMTAYVKELNENKVNSKKQYQALNEKYQISLDTIKILREKLGKAIIDSSKKIIVVPFSGKKSIASYSGYTEYNWLTFDTYYSLEINFDEIVFESKLIKDKSDNLWKIETISHTPGLKLRCISTIDDDAMMRLTNNCSDYNKPGRFGLGISCDSKSINPGILIRKNNYNINIGYKLFTKESIDKWYNRLNIGLYHYIF